MFSVASCSLFLHFFVEQIYLYGTDDQRRFIRDLFVQGAILLKEVSEMGVAEDMGETGKSSFIPSKFANSGTASTAICCEGGSPVASVRITAAEY